MTQPFDTGLPGAFTQGPPQGPQYSQTPEDVPFSLAGTRNDDPNALPEKTDLLFVFGGAEIIVAKSGKNAGKTQVVLRFTTDASTPPPYAGKRQDDFITVTGASDDNKFWAKQRLMSLGMPVQLIDAIQSTRQLVDVLNRLTNRKYIGRVFKNSGGYQNFRPGTDGLKPYVNPVTTQATENWSPAQNVQAPQPPVSQPSAGPDPWAQPAQAPQVYQAPQVTQPAPVANDPWANAQVPSTPGWGEQVNPTQPASAPTVVTQSAAPAENASPAQTVPAPNVAAAQAAAPTQEQINALIAGM